MKNPAIKPFPDKKLLSEILFYKGFLEEPNVTKYLKAFKNFTWSYTVEVLSFQDQTIQLSIAKPLFKSLLKDLKLKLVDLCTQ